MMVLNDETKIDILQSDSKKLYHIREKNLRSIESKLLHKFVLFNTKSNKYGLCNLEGKVITRKL